MKHVLPVVLLPALLLLSLPARAEFHLWRISEIFSNPDGSVQYIELTSTGTGQGLLTDHTLLSSGTSSGNSTLTFGSDLSGDTAGRSFLVATQGFANLTGLSPDYTIPAGFIPVDGGSLNFGEGASVMEFERPQLPLNGIQALTSDLQPVTASPTNFSDLSATVAADANARGDLSTGIVSIPVVDVPGMGLANVSFDVDLTTEQFTLRDDFYLYAAGISAGDAPARLQNGSVLHVPALVAGNQIFEFNVSIVSDNPIVFGNLEILGVATVPPEPEPEPEPDPEPEPEPDSDTASISRGEDLYANLCVSCHGSTGNGGIGPSLVTSSFNTFDPLRTQIHNNMPNGNPSACVDSGTSTTCATDVANFILNVFQGGSASSSGDIEVSGY